VGVYPKIYEKPDKKYRKFLIKVSDSRYHLKKEKDIILQDGG